MEKEIIVISAVAKNGIIGNKGTIPWYISEDFKRFKELTKGCTVVMGGRTWDSLPKKPLPNRENFIVRREGIVEVEGATVTLSIKDAIEKASNEKVFLIGGRGVYMEGVTIADRLELTEVDLEPVGDTSFPEFDKNDWTITNREDHEGFSFVTYMRKKDA